MAVKYSKLSDFKIKKIIRCFCADIDATKAGIVLGFNRKTINKYYLLFRECIYESQLDNLKEIFTKSEMCEPNLLCNNLTGASSKKNGNYSQALFGMVEYNGHIYTDVIPEERHEVFWLFAQGKVSYDDIAAANSQGKYDGVIDIRNNRCVRINGAGNTQLNGIESFWSFSRRRLGKFNGVKKYYHYHLKECEWRWKKKQGQMEKELWKMLLKRDKKLYFFK